MEKNISIKSDSPIQHTKKTALEIQAKKEESQHQIVDVLAFMFILIGLAGDVFFSWAHLLSLLLIFAGAALGVGSKLSSKDKTSQFPATLKILLTAIVPILKTLDSQVTLGIFGVLLLYFTCKAAKDVYAEWKKNRDLAEVPNERRRQMVVDFIIFVASLLSFFFLVEEYFDMLVVDEVVLPIFLMSVLFAISLLKIIKTGFDLKESTLSNRSGLLKGKLICQIINSIAFLVCLAIYILNVKVGLIGNLPAVMTIVLSAFIGMTSTYYEHKYIKQLKEYKADEHEPAVVGMPNINTPLLNPSGNSTYSTALDTNRVTDPMPIDKATSHESVAHIEGTATLPSLAPLVIATNNIIPPGSAAIAAAGIASIATTAATTSSIHNTTTATAAAPI